jgi:beta-glucosidase
MTSTSTSELLRKMTLEEKVAQVGAISIVDLLDDGALSQAKLRQRLAHGIGQITRVAGWSNLPPAAAADVGRAIQEFLRRETRLGVPAILHEECLSGLAARGATTFPQAITMASTWNPALIGQVGDAIRKEMLAIGARQGLGPVLDLVRDPRWGRCEETYGEDPCLVSSIALAYIRGLQGEDLRDGVGATPKHFVAHGAPEGGRNEAPVAVGPRELRDMFMVPFERAVKEGRVFSLMNAYHDLDGIPCAGSHELLTRILREQWGFEGVVVSDYEAVDQLRRMHFVAQDKADAAAQALEAGIDVELPFIDCFGEPLAEAVRSGRLGTAVLDRAVLRVLQAKERLGLFDTARPITTFDVDVINCEAHRALAGQVARDALTLLKNDRTLPLARDGRSIAVIGPNADSVRNLLGDYAYEAMTGHPDTSTPSCSVLEGVRRQVGPHTKVWHAAGCDVGGPDTSGFAAAVDAARKSEVAILVVGGRSGCLPVLRGYAEHGDTSGEGRDRAEIGLPGVQEALVEAVAATGTPLVLVVVDGRPLALQGVAHLATAILYAWLPGSLGGSAVAAALFGDIDPAGRLPVTLPRNVGQIPVHYNRHPASNKWHYIFGPNTPLFPFGHGLSYAQFSYGRLHLEANRLPPDGTIHVEFDVTNTADRPGVEVPQLYVRDLTASVVRPIKELKAFTKVSLAAGATERVALEVPVSALAFHNRSMRRVVEPGAFELQIGRSSDDIHLRETLWIDG